MMPCPKESRTPFPRIDIMSAAGLFGKVQADRRTFPDPQK